ncbi:ABC transporter ATP-binding protein [Corynebacterium antarcticum]|uniref:ABC transporter ATP-binding protein n=1 Tax=Corynebacterium antarcticum TaxID=2800405 RepID=UPI002005566A|nr:ATP-binding cassette domain-containing protein [Corynebacterium antarcticum]
MAPDPLTGTRPRGAAIRATGFGWRHAGRLHPTISELDLDIEPGQRILLLGESGSGKSTLLAAIAGVLGGDDEGDRQGTLLVDGHPPEQARGVVGMVLQDPDSQVISSRVGDDVAFGCENLGVEREEIWRRVARALELVGLDLPLDHPTAELSGGQKQRLALAGVIAMGARLILLDEPTANLDPDGVAEVRDAVDRVARETGATLIVVEHRVEIWSGVVDHALVLGTADRGLIAAGPLDDVIAAEGTRLADNGVWVPGIPLDLPPAETAEGVAPVPALDAVDLTVGWEEGRAVGPPHNLILPEGRSTVITGPNGAGKSTLALTLAGLLDPLGGSVHAGERVASGLSGGPHSWSSRDLATRIGFVFQDPEHQFVARTVRSELLIGPAVTAGGRGRLGLWRRLTGHTPADAVTAADRERVDELLVRLRLDHLAEANPFSLSGGQKRRLSVATALVTTPSVLILDEPTFGQDRRTFTELVLLLRGLVDSGVTLASITHDDLFAGALGDHGIEVGKHA